MTPPSLYRDTVTSKPSPANDSPWPHRLAVLLVCATFPLIWVGGLVTTYDAGMAVPDWPTTYGYNLFAYPWQTWLLGPWDLFIEHGHRLLGALVGIIAILFVAAVCWFDARRWMRLAAMGALLLVVCQGLLGGARVLLDERTLAMLHGCLGPAFFGYGVALAVITSPPWKAAPAASACSPPAALHRVALLTMVVVYVQLVLGAQVRHVAVTAAPGEFRVAVLFHLLMAVVVCAYVLQLLGAVLRLQAASTRLRRPALVLGGLLLLQLVLGCATWVSKYGWPDFVARYPFAAGHVVQAHSMGQALIVTSHVAVGSLILALTVLLFTRSLRNVRVPAMAVSSGALMLELAT